MSTTQTSTTQTGDEADRKVIDHAETALRHEHAERERLATILHSGQRVTASTVLRVLHAQGAAAPLPAGPEPPRRR